MPNFDGEWELRIYYETTPTGHTLMEHRLTIDVAVDGTPAIGDGFNDIAILQRNGLGSFLDIQTDALVALLLPFFPATADITRAELWHIPEGTMGGTWYSTYAIGEAGTAGTASIPGGQVTMTFRSLGGGTARIQLMETFVSPGVRIGYPTGNALYDDLMDHAVSAATPFVARDNEYFIGGIAALAGENEKLWRKRFRA